MWIQDLISKKSTLRSCYAKWSTADIHFQLCLRFLFILSPTISQKNFHTTDDTWDGLAELFVTLWVLTDAFLPLGTVLYCGDPWRSKKLAYRSSLFVREGLETLSENNFKENPSLVQWPCFSSSGHLCLFLFVLSINTSLESFNMFLTFSPIFMFIHAIL